jgi:hypothetical protein
MIGVSRYTAIKYKKLMAEKSIRTRIIGNHKESNSNPSDVVPKLINQLLKFEVSIFC